VRCHSYRLKTQRPRPSANSADASPCVLLHGKAILCASCSRSGKGDDWPLKMGQLASDAYLMWPCHVAIPGLHQEHTFQAPNTRAFAGMCLEIRRIAPLDAIKLRTAAFRHINAHPRPTSPISLPPSRDISSKPKKPPILPLLCQALLLVW